MKRTVLGALAALCLASSVPAHENHCKMPVQECIDHMTKSLASRGWLGVQLEPAPSGMAVTKIVEGSPASKAGLREGDVLVSANGTKYAGMDEKGEQAIKEVFTPGNTVSFAIERDGKAQEVKVVLAPMPDDVRAQIIGMHAQEHSSSAAEARASVKELSVEEVAQLIEAGKAVVVDANGREVRSKWGIIPGATLLTSASGYSAAELPSDKSKMLVFYCANTRCTASDTAAKVARERGYEHVGVLRAGIMGWKDAGQKTATPST